MDKISTVIISDEFSTKEVLKLFVSEFDNLETIDDFNNYSDIFNILASSKGKSLLIVDLSTNKIKNLDFILQVTKECKNCKVLALSDNPSVELIIEVMRAGAKEFVPVPIIKNEFFEAIKKLVTEMNEPVKKNKCKIISVFSNKGGIGKTSLATNLALELAKITKENIALIDLNFQMGDITTFLDLKPSFNISYMLENLDKINETFLLSTLERYKSTSLYVLADPPYFKQADNIQPRQITRLFDTLKETFSYIIVDAEASFDGKNIAALDNSDLIMLVTVANLPALRNTQRCLELFEKLGYDKEKIKIVVNRYMENDEIKEVDIEKVLSKNIYWKIPNNYFAIMSAINKGIPVSDVNDTTNVSQSYKKLAQQISDNLYRQNMVEKFENILNNN
ncbi:CobQ/CobB/MinD/ParA nucleotide binding domain-containing protein [bacterium]|nr:CobQ/CobB/MinD/ParA nucleotide binding domain-containing protein [bacterium]